MDAYDHFKRMEGLIMSVPQSPDTPIEASFDCLQEVLEEQNQIEKKTHHLLNLAENLVKTRISPDFKPTITVNDQHRLVLEVGDFRQILLTDPLPTRHGPSTSEDTLNAHIKFIDMQLNSPHTALQVIAKTDPALLDNLQPNIDPELRPLTIPQNDLVEVVTNAFLDSPTTPSIPIYAADETKATTAVTTANGQTIILPNYTLADKKRVLQHQLARKQQVAKDLAEAVSKTADAFAEKDEATPLVPLSQRFPISFKLKNKPVKI